METGRFKQREKWLKWEIQISFGVENMKEQAIVGL